MRALVTGCKGFIGRHMSLALKRAGYELDGLDTKLDLGSDARRLPSAVNLPDGKYDLVVHCAALVEGRETIDNKAALLGAYNLQLDGALFEWALKARPGRIVYFSSSAAYPTRLQNGLYADGSLPLSEHMMREEGPDATYGWTKVTGEKIAAEVRKAGIPVTVVRPFSGYGDDQDECYPFPAMIARAKRGDSPFEVWGNGTQVRDFVHVDDICGAVMALIEGGVDGPVNIGTGRGTSMDQLARLCMETAGYSTPIRHLTEKPAGVQYRVCDPTLLRQWYTPTIALEEGVERALAA